MRTTKDQVVANGKHSNGATARKNGSSAEAESADSALARAFAAFARVGEKLEKARDVDELLRSIVHEVRELVGVERCSIHLRDEKAGLFRGLRSARVASATWTPTSSARWPGCPPTG